MPARILIHSADPMVRHRVEMELKHDPEHFLEPFRKKIAAVGEPPSTAPKLVHSMRSDEWKKTERRRQREFRQRLVEQRRQAQVLASLQPEGRYSWGRRLKAAMEAKKKEEREGKG